MDSNRVRWHKGTPEKIGGWAVQPLTLSGAVPAEIAPLSQVYSVIDNVTVINPQPSTLIDFVEGFTANIGQFTTTSAFGTDPHGTLAIGGGIGTATIATGAFNSSFYFLNGKTLPLPQGFIAIDLVQNVATGAPAYQQISVGLYKDGNNMLSFGTPSLNNGTGANGFTLPIGTPFGFTQINAGAKTTAYPFTLPSSQTIQSIGMAIVCNSVTGWVKYGGVWHYAGSHAAPVDFTTPSVLSTFHPGFDVWCPNTGYTIQVANLTVGRFGAYGMRDNELVTHQDGTPYNPSGNVVLFTASTSDPASGSYIGLYSVDLGTFALTQIGVIMVARGGKVLPDVNCHIVLMNDGTAKVITATWANGFGGVILPQLTVLPNQAILAGSTVLTPSATLNLPGLLTGAYGAYDAYLVFNAATSLWMLAYSITPTTNFTGSPFYAALATSPDLVTWTLVGADTTRPGYEGTRIFQVNGAFYVLAGGPAGTGNAALVYNASMVFQGNLNAVFNGGAQTQPHPMAFPLGNFFYLITFDNTEANPGVSFTWGNFILERAPRFSSSQAAARYIGTVRGACDWASLDTQQWIAFGTECKLYLVNNNVLYDITPIRKTSNLLNPFTTIATSANVNVADTDHRSNVGDHVHVISASAVGGLVLLGDYSVVAVIDNNNYTITAASAATGSATGGASATINYDIYCGLANNGFLYGYGTGPYGGSTYGTPRTAGNGVPAKMRTWSLQNWGEDLIASFSDGEIYWWKRSSGPNTPAALLVNAPVDVQRVLVNADSEFVIAVGASDITGNADRMNVRWCSEANLTDWLPVILPVANTAGGQRLNFGSTLVAAIQSRGANFLWSDTQLYQMQFIGPPNIFGFTELGKCSIVGPNAPIDVNGTIRFMGYDDFFIFDGTLRVLPCEMWETVFEDFDRTQAQAVYCSSNRTKNEVQWLYPSSKVPGQMNYVVFNYEDECWYGGIMPRTCYQDVSAAISGFFETPYAFNGGYLYQHELGFDEVEASGTVAMDWFLQSWDIGMNSDRGILINSMVPNFDRLSKGLQFSYQQKNYPTEAATVVGPFIVTPTTTKLDARAHGTQIALRIERAMVAGQIVFGQDFRLGVWQSLATQYGRRLSGSSMGAPIDTSGP